jgi:hypothetical protein
MIPRQALLSVKNKCNMGRLFVGVLSPELPSEYTQKMV